MGAPIARLTCALLALVFLPLVLTCGGDDLVEPAGAPAALAIVTQPSPSAQSDVPLDPQPVIQVRDAEGNPVPRPGGGTVTAAVVGGGAALGGTVTMPFDGSGRATYTGLKLTGPAGSYNLLFTSAALTQAVSQSITLGLGGSAIVTVTTQPPATTLDHEVFIPSRQPVVRVTDASGIPLSGVGVTASIATGPGSIEGSTNATTGSDGLAAFLDLGIGGTGAHTLRFVAGGATGVSSTVTVSALAAEATTGHWGPVVGWNIVPLHMHLLPTGKVLAWGKVGQPELWDPAGGFTTVAVDTMLFCAGHALQPDGKLLVAGGHLADDHGLAVTNLFDPAGQSWSSGLPDMASGRWYPTVTALPDGRMLAVAGRDESGVVAEIPEVWNGSQWTRLTGANLALPYYPRNFVAPDGRVFYAGERVQSRWLSVSGTGQWVAGPSHRWPFERDYGSAVMYQPGKILYVGGGGDPGATAPTDATSSVPTSSAEIIDLNAGSPQWSYTDSMSVPRRHLNATILPDGQVLVTGGTRGGGFDDLSDGNAARAAELWDPTTHDWTTLASNAVTRVYHSVSLLLPDGTVVHGASGDAIIGGSPAPRQTSHEVFSPPYLFKGARPTIAAAPSTVGYGQTFFVTTPYAGQVTTARWIRLGSVTHAFDAGQRANSLAVAPAPTGVNLTAPASPNLAPPGHYLLFLLNRNGVPSEGMVVRIQ